MSATTSAQLAGVISDETGSGALMFATSPVITTDITIPNTGLHLLDTNASHDLIIAPGSDLTADRTLTLTTGDAARTITLSGNPTLNDWFDQAVKVASTPAFTGLTLAAAYTNPAEAKRALIAGLVITNTVAPDANFHIGIDASVTIAGSQNVTGIVKGIQGSIYHTGSGDIAKAFGLLFSGGCNSTGNITALHSIRAESYGVGGGSVVTMYGYSLKNQSLYNTPTTMFGFHYDANTTAQGTNKYAFYAGDVSGASTGNYSIYTNAGDISLGGNVTFRQAATIACSAGDLTLAPAGGDLYVNANTGVFIAAPTNHLHVVGDLETPSLRVGSKTSPTHYWDLGRENALTGDFVILNAAGASASEHLRITTGTGRFGFGIATSIGGKVHIDQSSTTAAIPVLILDQGDVSEQCIQFSSDATDRDVHLFTVDVTGTPAMDWLETADIFSLNKGIAIGDGGITNYANFAADGELTLAGTARVINTIWVDAGGIKAPGAKPATAVAHGVLETPAWSFGDEALEANEETVSFSIRIPNRMDRAVAPTIGLGWSADGANAGVCEWQLEYLWTAQGEDTGAAAQETLYATGTAPATADGLVYTEITGIDVPGSTDACIHCRLKRLSSASAGGSADTIAIDVHLHGVCFNWTSDKLGTATT